MVNQYKQYLRDKGTKNFWKKAKQREYTIDVVKKIFFDLTDGFSALTTRNSITLRYLGLVINLGADKLVISNAGNTFLESPYKQKILDEQIMKVYLDCPKLNDNLVIKIIPMEVLLNLLLRLDYISFDEYDLFVCWVNSKEEVDLVIKLIKEYRTAENKIVYSDILDQKSEELGIKDFSANVKRFFDMILISSYLRKEGGKIFSNLLKKDIEIVLASFAARDFSDEGYFDYLIKNDGWQIYADNPDYVRVIESLKQKTTEEQEEIINKIAGKLEFPSILTVIPQVINIEIDGESTLSEKTGKKRLATVRKIDFELRDSNNRAAGDFAEKIIIKHEVEELNRVSIEKSNKIRQVSLKDDTLGYDILSFNPDGSEKHIEVKAVRRSPASIFKFYISENEVAIAKRDPYYHLYVVFDYLSEKPFIYKMPNPFIHTVPGVLIDPIKYLVTVMIKSHD